MDKFSHDNNLKQGKFTVSRTGNDRLFAILGLLLAAVLISVVIFLFQFLISNVNRAINIDLIKNQEIVRFNLNQLESLRRK